MYKYFCNTCGTTFESDVEDELSIVCPNPTCGCYDIYPDTGDGIKQAFKDFCDYDNEIALLEKHADVE